MILRLVGYRSWGLYVFQTVAPPQGGVGPRFRGGVGGVTGTAGPDNGVEITPQITLLLTFFGKKSYPPFIFVTKGTEAPPRHAEIARDR